MFEREESGSDAEVLGVLVGVREAARLLRAANGSLAALLGGGEVSVPVQPGAQVRLRAARELVRRSLLETVRKSDALSSPGSVRDYLRMVLAGREHEVFVVIFLDAQNRAIAVEELFRGTLTQTSVYPREVVKRCLAHNAASVIFAHNHPSGVAEPSQADELLTTALRQALALVDVRVLDHFVVAGTGASSFAERGLL